MSAYLKQLSLQTWEKGSNPLLVDYRTYQTSGKIPSALRRTWTFVANLTATVAWSVLAVPGAIVTGISFGKIKNKAWIYACERGNFTKTAFYALSHFKETMAALRAQEAGAYYRDQVNKTPWAESDQKWSKLSQLCTHLTPTGLADVCKDISQSPHRVPFLKALLPQCKEEALQTKVRQELYQLGWIGVQISDKECPLYPRRVVEQLVSRKQKLQKALQSVANAQGGEVLVLEAAHANKFKHSLDKLHATHDLLASYQKVKALPTQDPAWKTWYQHVADLKASQFTHLVDELGIDLQNRDLLQFLLKTLRLKWQETKFVREPRCEKLEYRFSTLLKKTFEVGYVTELIENFKPVKLSTLWKENLLDLVLYPRDILEAMLCHQEARFSSRVKDAVFAKGDMPIKSTDVQNSCCKDIVEGKSSWWVENKGGVIKIDLAGLDEIVEKAQTVAAVRPMIENLFKEFAAEIIGQKIPFQDTHIKLLQKLVQTYPQPDLEAALLLEQVRRDPKALEGCAEPLMKCAKLNTILFDLIQLPAFANPNNTPKVAALKTFLGTQIVSDSRTMKFPQAVDSAAVHQILTFDQMCDLISKPEAPYALFTNWLKSISGLSPAQLGKLAKAIKIQFSTLSKMVLQEDQQMAAMWSLTDDEGRLVCMQTLAGSDAWSDFPLMVDIVFQFASSPFALGKDKKMCDRMTACLVALRKNPSPGLSYEIIVQPEKKLAQTLSEDFPRTRDAILQRLLQKDWPEIEKLMQDKAFETDLQKALDAAAASGMMRSANNMRSFEFRQEAFSLWRGAQRWKGAALGDSFNALLSKQASIYKQHIDTPHTPLACIVDAALEASWKQACAFIKAQS